MVGWLLDQKKDVDAKVIRRRKLQKVPGTNNGGGGGGALEGVHWNLCLVGIFEISLMLIANIVIFLVNERE